MDGATTDWRNHTAVIIGAGGGVGRGLALGFADAGMRVVVADIDAASIEARSSASIASRNATQSKRESACREAQLLARFLSHISHYLTEAPAL